MKLLHINFPTLPSENEIYSYHIPGQFSFSTPPDNALNRLTVSHTRKFDFRKAFELK